MRNEPCWCGSGKKQKKCHKDVVGNSAFASLEKYYENLDTKVSSEVGSLPCRMGCAQCCYDHFSVSSIEWYYIMNHILDKHGISKVQEVIDKGYALWEEFKEKRPDLAESLILDLSSRNNEHDKQFKEKTGIILETMGDSNEILKEPCIFLDKDTHTCTVYDVRPIICRKFGVSYTVEKEETTVQACEMITGEIETYISEMVDLTEDLEQSSGFQYIYLNKFDAMANDRPYPFFYLCKIQKENQLNMTQKIDEFKSFSLEEVYTKKAERLSR